MCLKGYSRCVDISLNCVSAVRPKTQSLQDMGFFCPVFPTGWSTIAKTLQFNFYRIKSSFQRVYYKEEHGKKQMNIVVLRAKWFMGYLLSFPFFVINSLYGPPPERGRPLQKKNIMVGFRSYSFY